MCVWNYINGRILELPGCSVRMVNDTWCTLTITCSMVHHGEQQTRKATTIESIGHCSSSSEERDGYWRWFIAGIIPLPAIRLHTATHTILISPLPLLTHSFIRRFFLIHRLLPDQLINRCWNAAEIELGMLRIIRFHDWFSSFGIVDVIGIR